MKRAFCTILLLLAMCSPVAAFEAAIATAPITASGQAVTGACWITGLQVLTNGTNDATITLYDGTGTGGNTIGTYYVPGALYGDRKVWTFPRRAAGGIYVTVTGTGASAVIEYRK